MNFPEDVLKLGSYNLVEFGNSKFLEYFSKQDIHKRHVNSSSFALSFVIDGTKIIYTPAGKVIGEKGDCLLIGKGHSIMSERIPNDSTPYQNVLFFISDEFVNQFYQKHYQYFATLENNAVSPQVAKTKVDKILSNFLLSILLIIKNEQLKSKEILDIKLEELLLYILNINSSIDFRLLLSTTFADITSDFKSTILNNFDVHFTTEDYAHLCAMSLSTFKRKFGQFFDCSPGQWIVYKKMEMAERLLNSTNKTIESIAFEVGYESTSRFIEAFKSVRGTTPAQHRLEKNQ